MTPATKTTRHPKNDIVREAIALRSECDGSLVGANKADRRFLKSAITILDRVISLRIELDAALDCMHDLSKPKRRPRVTHAVRVSR